MSEVRLKRLLYRSWHRGTKETDLILGNFAEKRLGELDGPMLDTYEQLLEENDTDIWNWIIGKAVPDGKYAPLLTYIKEDRQ